MSAYPVSPSRLPILPITCQTFPMRNLTILLALIFTVMFPSSSFAEWKGMVWGADFQKGLAAVQAKLGTCYALDCGV
jgi:hypothetical protein